MAIYLKYGSVRGGATARGYRSWIELETARYATLKNSQGFGSGGSSGADVVVTKRADVASAALYQECSQGARALAVIDFVQGGSVSYRLRLYETIITSWEYSGYGDDAVELLTLNFSKIEYIPTPGVPAR